MQFNNEKSTLGDTITTNKVNGNRYDFLNKYKQNYSKLNLFNTKTNKNTTNKFSLLEELSKKREAKADTVNHYRIVNQEASNKNSLIINKKTKILSLFSIKSNQSKPLNNVTNFDTISTSSKGNYNLFSNKSKACLIDSNKKYFIIYNVEITTQIFSTNAKVPITLGIVVI